MEAALLTLVQAMSNYSASNAKRNDFRILNAGAARKVVLSQGSIPRREHVAAPRRIHNHYIININVFVPYTDELINAMTSLQSEVKDIIEEIDKYPTLNGTSNCVHAMIMSASEPSLWARDNGRRWWSSQLVCEVIEGSNVTIAE